MLSIILHESLFAMLAAQRSQEQLELSNVWERETTGNVFNVAPPHLPSVATLSHVVVSIMGSRLVSCFCILIWDLNIAKCF